MNTNALTGELLSLIANRDNYTYAEFSGKRHRLLARLDQHEPPSPLIAPPTKAQLKVAKKAASAERRKALRERAKDLFVLPVDNGEEVVDTVVSKSQLQRLYPMASESQRKEIERALAYIADIEQRNKRQED